MELWLLIIPSALTVMGWFVAAYWAIKQVNLAHARNRELQAAMLRQSKKDNLASNFINTYLDIAHAIAELKLSMDHVGLNMGLDQAKIANNVTFGWRERLDRIDSAYSDLGKHFNHLEIWLEVHGEHIPNTAKISAIIDDYQIHFTTRDPKRDPVWLLFQTALAGIRINNRPDSEVYNARSLDVKKRLDEIWTNLKEEAKTVERYLLAPRSINI